MSSLVYPGNIPGMTFSGSRVPVFNTGIQTAVSGKETRMAYQRYPRVKFSLQYELLRDNFGQTNYCLWSQDLTQSAWTKNVHGTGIAPIVTGNYSAAPDGTLTATRVILNRGSGNTSGDWSQCYQQIITLLGQSVTSSIWIKTNDGSTKSVGLYSPAASLKIVSVSSSWQRFSNSESVVSTNILGLILWGSFGTSSAADISVWGGQIEPGVVATTYIPTTTTPVGGTELKSLVGLFYAMQGQYDTFLYQDPDFNTVGLAAFGAGDGATTVYQLTAIYQATYGPGARELIQNLNGAPQIYINRFGVNELMSPVSRTNLALESQTITSATWSKANVTVTNALNAPDGTFTGDVLVENSAADVEHYVQQITMAVPSGPEDVTFTCYLQTLNARNWAIVRIFEETGGTEVRVFFNLTGTGSIGTTVVQTNWANLRYDIKQAGASFYRCTVTATKINAATACDVIIESSNGDNVYHYVGANTANCLGIWGVQFEVGSNSTMYLPTTSAAITATDYTLSTTGVVTCTTPPVNASVLSWSGSFYYRCRFTSDTLDNLSEFMDRWWQIDNIEFISVKL